MNSDMHGAGWRTTSYSNGSGECVEVAIWRTASYSGAEAHCAEVGRGDGVGVRDTKDRDGVVLRVSAETWQAFTDVLKGR